LRAPEHEYRAFARTKRAGVCARASAPSASTTQWLGRGTMGAIAATKGGEMLNIDAVRTLLLGIAALLIVVVGIRIISRSGSADYAEVARTSANTIIGIVFLAVGAGAFAIIAFGESILAFLGIGQ
jgi:hypothetical protein